MKTMKLRPKIVSAIIIFLLLLIALYLSFDRVAIYVFSKTHNLDITYKGLRRISTGELLFHDLGIIDKKIGIGIFSKSGKVAPGAQISFDMRDVHFIKNGKEPAAAYDSLTDLVAIPFNSRWTYKEISGKITRSKNGIDIQELTAIGDEIKLSIKGTVSGDNIIDTAITIYFSDKLLREVPEELSNVLMRDEDGGWKSLAVNLKGNYSAPSIEVSGKLFRLKIGVASGS